MNIKKYGQIYSTPPLYCGAKKRGIMTIMHRVFWRIPPSLPLSVSLCLCAFEWKKTKALGGGGVRECKCCPKQSSTCHPPTAFNFPFTFHITDLQRCPVLARGDIFHGLWHRRPRRRPRHHRRARHERSQGFPDEAKLPYLICARVHLLPLPTTDPALPAPPSNMLGGRAVT